MTRNKLILSKKRRVLIFFWFFLVFSVAAFCQEDVVPDTIVADRTVEEPATVDTVTITYNLDSLRQVLSDSLALVHSEKYLVKLDSVIADCEAQRLNFINKFSDEKNLYTETIRKLKDSLVVLSANIFYLNETDFQYDKKMEEKYFNFENVLKGEKARGGGGIFALDFTSGDFLDFQINEMKTYLADYFPDARCDLVRDYLSQLYIQQEKWARAELSIMKFLYIYPESAIYEKVQTDRTKIFEDEKYFDDEWDFLQQNLASLPEKTDVSFRFFKFLELLYNVPNIEVAAFFYEEARQFLLLFPHAEQSPLVSFWLAEKYRADEKDQNAFSTLQKMKILYPECDEYPLAHYRMGNIQEENYTEYEAALATYYNFLECFNDDSLAQDVYYRIGKIYDENLENWEKASEGYQIYADKFAESPKAVACLQRKAVILAEELTMLDSSVATYHSITERYPESEYARGALLSAGDLYEENKQYPKAVVEYMLLFEKYPTSQHALTALKKAQIVYEKELNNREKTIEVLNNIIANFPDSKSASKAQKELDKLKDD